MVYFLTEIIMSKAIQHMMDEHQTILKVLAAFDLVVQKLLMGEKVPREDVAKFGYFFKYFADKLHHGKEEDRLFRKMVENGFPRDYGPVGVMLSEHEMGRECVKLINEIGSLKGELNKEEIEKIIHIASEFIQLLFFHIHKEDNVLYPMAKSALPATELENLDKECEDYERESFSEEEIKQLYTLAEELTRLYSSSVENLYKRLAPAGGCFMSSCGH